jgi:hypothetical protein
MSSRPVLRLLLLLLAMAAAGPVLLLDSGLSVSEGWAQQRRRTARARKRLATQLMRRGLQLMAQAHYKEAIANLTASFKLVPSGRVLLAIGQCQELLGRLEQAARTYERLLRGGVPAGIDENAVRQRLTQVQERLKSGARRPVEPPESQPVAKRPTQPTEPTEDKGETDEEGDTVDLGGGPDTIKLEEPESSSVAPSEVSGLISGWYKSILSVDLGHDRARLPTDMPEDSLEFRNRMLLRVDVRYGASFQAFAAALLDWVILERPPEGDASFWLFNGSEVRSSFEASVVEAFVSFHRNRFDVRAGMLRLAWGRCDFFSANDVINPRDYRNFLREEQEIVRLPVLAVEASLNLSPFTLEAVWQPIFRPDTISLYGTDFGIISPAAPQAIRGLGRYLSGLHPSDPSGRLENLILSSDAPPADPRASSGGLRATLSIKGLDFGAYYFYGWDPTPALDFSPLVLQALEVTNWSTANLQTLIPLLGWADAGMSIYRARYARRHHAGADFTTTLRSFTLRADAGFDSDRIFRDTRFTSHNRALFSGTVAAEYQHTVEHTVLLEVSYTHIFDAPPDLVFYGSRMLSVGTNIRWTFLDGDLVPELRVAMSFWPWGYLIQPQISYRISKSWSAQAGAMILGGDSRSLGGYYDRNDLVFFAGTYRF